jgi:hypothetical protein
MSLLEGASRISNGASGVLKGASPVSKPARGQTGSKSTLTTSGRTGAAVTRPRSRLPQRQLNTEKNVQLEELADRLKELQKSYKSDKTDSGFSPEERAALTEKLISNYKSSRVGSEEAKKLGDLGKQLENVREDPNGSLPATSRSKKRSKPAQNKPMRK